MKLAVERGKLQILMSEMKCTKYIRNQKEMHNKVLDSGSVEELDATLNRKVSQDQKKSSFSTDRVR